MMIFIWWVTLFDEMLADLAEAYWAAEYRRVIAGLK